MTRPPRQPDSISDTFCILPWVHLFADELGVMRPCCMTLEARDEVNRAPDGKPYVVYHPEGIEEAWNSPFLRRVRLDMMTGQRPDVCRQCFREEDLAMRSHRQGANREFEHLIASAIESTSADGSSPTELIRSVDLRLGNLCNLRCRMCSPVSSKLLIREFAALNNVPENDERLERLRRLDWFTRKDFWDTFEKYVPQMDLLHFAGGEPLLIPQMIEFLERVVDSGKSSQITLTYITNLTTLPPKVIELWPKFKRVSLMVSLDGFGDVNSLIRFPSRWEKIDENLRQLDRYGAEYNCQAVKLNTTVQVYNVLRLHELFEYTFSNFEHIVPFPKLTLLTYPPCFSTRILPQPLKELAATRLREFMSRWENRWPQHGEDLDRFLAAVDGVIDHMMSENYEHEIPEFVRRSLLHDQYRGEDTCQQLQELAPLFETIHRSDF